MSAGTAETDAVVAARALTRALTSLADALAKGDVARVLDAEPELTTALASMVAVRARLAEPHTDKELANAIATELLSARVALARCAALGASLDDFVRQRGYTAATYSRSGDTSPVAMRASSGGRT